VLCEYKHGASEKIVRFIKDCQEQAFAYQRLKRFSYEVFKFDFNFTISEISLLSEIPERQEDLQDIMNGIMDARCQTFNCRDGLYQWITTSQRRNSLYVTPHFLSHFDFNHISNTQLISTFAMFLSYQLGFFI